MQRPLPVGDEGADRALVGQVERPTRNARLPVDAVMSAAARSPAAASRTASVTSAPMAASVRAVSTPMPDEAPVTTARFPDRSMPAASSVAVE